MQNALSLVWSSHIKGSIMILYKYSGILIFPDTPNDHTIPHHFAPTLKQGPNESDHWEEKRSHNVSFMGFLCAWLISSICIYQAHCSVWKNRKSNLMIKFFTQIPGNKVCSSFHEYTTFVNIRMDTYVRVCICTHVHMYTDVHVYINLICHEL